MNSLDLPALAEVVRKGTMAMDNMPVEVARHERPKTIELKPKAIYDEICGVVARLNRDLASPVFTVTPTVDKIDAELKSSRAGWISVHVYFEPVAGKGREQVAFFQIATTKQQTVDRETLAPIAGAFHYEGSTGSSPEAIETLIVQGTEEAIRKLVRTNADRTMRPDLYDVPEIKIPA
ncbi:MAG: hypothetical protein HY817_00330 [Candidatus Abawacabacteria bacterium]|nr:hypothetical protein [Candidatus Abawacabacteria bacterium]